MTKILIAWLLCFANVAYGAGPVIWSSPVAQSIPYVDNISPVFGATNVQSAIDVLKNQVAGGIVNYNVVSSTTFNTTSTTDVVITGMTVTPVAGTYGIWFNAAVVMSSSPVIQSWTIYSSGAAVVDSVRSQQSSRSAQPLFCATMSIVQVNGSQAIDVRVNTAGGTLTVNQRSLLLTRLGP